MPFRYSEAEQKRIHKVDELPVVRVRLTPKYIEQMLDRRRAHQCIKFRTTCTDCVPNL